MQIQGRIVNSKRHTIGYKIGGRNRSRAEAVALASANRVEGVTVRTGSQDERFIAGRPGYPRLSDLPTRISDRSSFRRAAH